MCSNANGSGHGWLKVSLNIVKLVNNVIKTKPVMRARADNEDNCYEIGNGDRDYRRQAPAVVRASTGSRMQRVQIHWIARRIHGH